jgi:hypothetical protein
MIGVRSRDLLYCSSSSHAGNTALDGTVSRPAISAFHSLAVRRSCAYLRLASAVCILAWCLMNRASAFLTMLEVSTEVESRWS